MNLTEADLKKLLPPAMTSDKSILLICEALESEISDMLSESDCVRTYDVNAASDAVLTHLAWMFNSDLFFTGSTIEQKRQLVENAIKLHRKRGTKYALEQAVRIVAPNANIVPWFEYDGGEPYHFKIEGVGILQIKQAMSLIFIVNAVKSLRDWLDGNFLVEENSTFGLSLGLNTSVSLKKSIDARDTEGLAEVCFLSPTTSIIGFSEQTLTAEDGDETEE